ncbi:hypothetical protein YPPY02_2030, partial [Yersinia pestis PY-02]|jgi:hypothetical protein
MCLG